MARRLPSAPPNLPGFSYVRVLGSGGFADVFLYEQNMPRRPVAVKVLLAEVVNDQVRQLFQAEANLMAQLSSHPSVLTVFQASVSSDGRPYIVMEYCSSVLSQRYRAEPLAVPDVLRIGIRVASAVETAHRAGVLHRDIKPANILVTAYGHPVLSDFGIAATLGQAESTDAVGLSIPWSAPEVLLDEVAGTVSSEVWSLGATLYSLLAGRSPFEVPGQENTPADLIARISKARIPTVGRADVPRRLESVLARAMSRRPEARQTGALELVRELQSIEADLGLTQTPLDVAMEDWAVAALGDPEDQTRISNVDALGPQPGRRRRKRAAASGRSGEVSSTPPGRGGNGQDSGHGRSGRRRGRGGSAVGVPSTRRRGAIMGAAMAALVVGLAGTAASLLVQEATGDIPTVRTLTGELAEGIVVFRWSDPGVSDGDSYVVSLGTGETSIQRGTEFSVDPAGESRICLTVSVNRGGKTGAPSGERCIDAPAGSGP